MKTKHTPIRLIAALALSLAMLPTAGYAAGGCQAKGKQVASQKGGQLASAKQTTRKGKKVCVVVVLIPGIGGQYPRRMEIVVPLN